MTVISVRSVASLPSSLTSLTSFTHMSSTRLMVWKPDVPSTRNPGGSRLIQRLTLTESIVINREIRANESAALVVCVESNRTAERVEREGGVGELRTSGWTQVDR